ncbi:MAG: hypothetical protein JWO38_4029 [Gemmataceae bacterium]|nr:hypothetical protein [Gemmataceae bacterium]
MTLRFLPLAAAAALLCVPPADATEAAKPAPVKPAAASPGEPFDVLCLADARPVAIRVRIAADGKPLDEAWKRFADTLFAKLDADKDGSIDGKELVKLRPMLALLTGRFDQSAAPTGPGGALTRAGFAEYLRKNGLGPFQLPAFVTSPVQPGRRIVRAGSVATPEDLDKALLGLLDANKDGKLSAGELAAAPAVFAALDADENEIITTDELLRRPAPLPFFVEEVVNSPAGPGLELLPLARKGSDMELARRLLTRYGAKPAGAAPKPPVPAPKAGERPRPAGPPTTTARRLTRKDLGLSAETFAALDQDGDEELDAEELARFGDSCLPEVEIAFRLGTLTAGARSAEVITAGKAPVTAAASGGAVAVEVPGARLDLIPPVGGAPRGAFRARYMNLFRTLDRDGNGYVDATEAGNDPLFREVFPLLDRDGDGKVFEKELTAALDDVDGVAAEAARGIVSVEVAEAGRGIFGLIDADGDGRLSVREIRAMPKLVERFDTNKDGAIAPGEVPRRFTAKLSRGLAIAGGARFAPVPVPMVGQPAPRPPVGPIWFQKMDRNRDGDVSRREFLGTDEDFRRLDTDGDGLIDAREAEAAGRDGGTTPGPVSESRK